MANTTRKRTHCDDCGRVIYTSAAKPKTLCKHCEIAEAIKDYGAHRCHPSDGCWKGAV